MSDQAGTLQIRIQRKTGDTWPVVVEWHTSGGFLPVRSEDVFHLGQEQQLDLTALALDPLAYGRILGQALFSGQVQRAFDRAQAASGGRLRVLLHVEDPELKSLHWERLCERLDDGAWNTVLVGLTTWRWLTPPWLAPC